MWTLILKLDNDEYDAIPNKWVISKERCWYPDKSKSSAVKLARESASIINKEDWLQMRMKIIQTDFENFERCMEDAIRLQRGKRTVTASENEERGRGLRAKRSLLLSEEESSPSKIPKLALRKSPRKRETGIIKFPECPKSPEKTIRSPNKRTNGNGKKTIQSKNGRTGNCKNVKQCTIKKKHYCLLKQGPVTIESIAQGICVISRSITILRNASEDCHREIMSKLNEITKSSVQNEENEGAAGSSNREETEALDFCETLSIFPLSTMEEFNQLNEKIMKDAEFSGQMAAALMSIAQKSTCSRAVTSILRYTLKEELVKNFSWKGQKRWNTQKIGFSNTAFSIMLVDSIKKKWKGTDQKKIEQAVAAWLAQTQLKAKQKTKDAANMEEEEETI